MRRIVPSTLFILAALLGACSTPARSCLEREECFAGEFCDRGTCRAYTGTTTTGPRGDVDMPPLLRLPDQDNPFNPLDIPPDLPPRPDLGPEDFGVEDLGAGDFGEPADLSHEDSGAEDMAAEDMMTDHDQSHMDMTDAVDARPDLDHDM